jgi:hypothetical protein
MGVEHTHAGLDQVKKMDREVEWCVREQHIRQRVCGSLHMRRSVEVRTRWNKHVSVTARSHAETNVD